MKQLKICAAILVANICTLSLLPSLLLAVTVPTEDVIKIGLNYPETGPYAKQGLDQRRGAEMAAEQINAAGGILGKTIQLVYRDTKSHPQTATQNAVELFDKEGVPMIFGGASSAVAIAVGKVALEKNRLFFGTMTYSTETTGEYGHRHIFRESYDSYFAGNVLSYYLNEFHDGDKYFYITADYTWGWTTESVLRKNTGTEDTKTHPEILTNLGANDFKAALASARDSNAKVLVLSLFGRDMEIAVRQAYEMGLKKNMQIIVPNLTLDMAQGAGPEAMEGIVGATPWFWKAPFLYNYPEGKTFTLQFEKLYQRYPTTAAASAYVILHQYKDAVERAKSFDTKKVITALEGYHYIGVKDEQYWRSWDHQSVQTVYSVRCRPANEVKTSKYQQDYYDVVNVLTGDEAAVDQREWQEIRDVFGMPTKLEEYQAGSTTGSIFPSQE